MHIILLSFTRNGAGLCRKIQNVFSKTGDRCECYSRERFSGSGVSPMPDDLDHLIGSNWGKCAFVFIGAAGIAVRLISPWVKDKFSDSAVVVMDEKGEFAIPILSGHIGGAVCLADRLAEAVGAVPVHTTATDVRKRFAVDVFAVKNHLYLTDPKTAKEISSAVLEGEKVAFLSEQEFCRLDGPVPEEIVVCASREEAERYRLRIYVTDDGEQKEGTLVLRPGNVTAGIGCRKGIGNEMLETGLQNVMRKHGLIPEQLEAVASIDLKKNEPAILALAEKYRIPFCVFTAEELLKIREVTSRSGFVLERTGVDNVCERAALSRCSGGILIQGKCVEPSMTVALARRPLVLKFGRFSCNGGELSL